MREIQRLAILLLWLVACSTGDEPAASNKLLAVVVDLSGPGREEGLQIRDAARLALREARRQSPGVVPVELLVQDDQGDPTRAARLARYVFELDEVIAVIGPSSLSAARSAIPEYDRDGDGVPTLLAARLGPEHTRGREWVFSLRPAARYLGETLAWFVVTQLAARRAASLFSADPYGESFDGGFFAEFERLGGTALSRVSFHSSLNALDRLPAEVGAAPAVVVAGTPAQTAGVIAALRAAGVVAPILVSEDPGSTSTPGEVFYPVVFDPAGPSAAQAFAASFQRAFGEPPGASAALAYDAAALVLKGLGEDATDRASLREWLAGVDAKAPFSGVTGDFFFSRDHDAVREISIAGVRAGARVAARQAP